MAKKTIEERNQEFLALPKHEQRIAIAKDVLKTLKSKKITAKAGDYFDFNGYYKLGKEDKGKDLQALLDKKNVTCTVCALGATFHSLVRLGDRFKLPQNTEALTYITDKEMRPLLRNHFSSKQIAMIESAFENGQCSDGKYTGNVEQSIDFGGRYEDPEDRLSAIMKNIIKNEGEFKP